MYSLLGLSLSHQTQCSGGRVYLKLTFLQMPHGQYLKTALLQSKLFFLSECTGVVEMLVRPSQSFSADQWVVCVSGLPAFWVLSDSVTNGLGKMESFTQYFQPLLVDSLFVVRNSQAPREYGWRFPGAKNCLFFVAKIGYFCYSLALASY